jgi:hypothetical protein
MSIFGKGLGDYHKDMEQMRREHEEQLKLMDYESQRRMMNAASSTPSIAELYENVKRANQITKDLMHKIDRTEKKVEMLTGFYTWITEVYPEIAAQHKAMRDLYEAANPTQTEAGP